MCYCYCENILLALFALCLASHPSKCRRRTFVRSILEWLAPPPLPFASFRLTFYPLFSACMRACACVLLTIPIVLDCFSPAVYCSNISKLARVCIKLLYGNIYIYLTYTFDYIQRKWQWAAEKVEWREGEKWEYLVRWWAQLSFGIFTFMLIHVLAKHIEEWRLKIASVVCLFKFSFFHLFDI